MGDETSAPEQTGPSATGPGASLLCGALAACGAVVMGMTIRSLLDMASISPEGEVLIVWVLLGVAALGALLCLYLALIWGLAAAIQLAGPATLLGSMLLGPLRVLAPRLARRLAGGAAVATAATVLGLGPGVAATSGLMTDLPEDRPTISQSAELLSAELPTQDPAPEAAAPGSDQEAEGTAPSAPLPSLGWDGGSAPATSGPAVGDLDANAPTDAPTAGAATAPEPSAGPGSEPGVADPAGPAQDHPAPARTVVVEQGDSLWSISDDLLGPGPSDPADVAALWPQLHETNRDLIGADPDRLHPGQELSVPSTVTPQDMP